MDVLFGYRFSTMVVVLLLVAPLLFAQEIIDIIETKDGSVYKGIIIENKVDDYVRIELSGGSVIKILYDNIDTFRRERSAQAPGQSQSQGTVINIENVATAEASAGSQEETPKQQTLRHPPVEFHKGGFFKNDYFTYMNTEHPNRFGYLSLMDVLQADPSLPASIDLDIKEYRKSVKLNRFAYWGGLAVYSVFSTYALVNLLEYSDNQGSYYSDYTEEELDSLYSKFLIGSGISFTGVIAMLMAASNLNDPPNRIVAGYNNYYMSK